MDIHFLDDSVETLIRSMEPPTIAKILRVLDLLETFGHKLGMPHAKSIGSGLLELRIQGHQEVRLIYVFREQRAIILHAFMKKRQKISQRDFETALHRLQRLDRI
jgi:phage-related protein